jgi:predicted nucleic acid-binding protein
MSAKYFLDTNIFVYTFDSESPDKQVRSRELVETALEDGRGCISYQVVQEFLNVATRKFAVPLSPADAEEYLSKVLDPLCEVFGSIALYAEALEVMSRWHYSFYDSLIIASSLAAGCRILYTEDLKSGQKIHSLEIVNPFA